MGATIDAVTLNGFSSEPGIHVTLTPPQIAPHEYVECGYYVTVATVTAATPHPVDGSALSVLVEAAERGHYMLWLPSPIPEHPNTHLLIPYNGRSQQHYEFTRALKQATEATRLLAQFAVELDPDRPHTDLVRAVVHGPPVLQDIIATRSDLPDEVLVALALNRPEQKTPGISWEMHTLYHRLTGRKHLLDPTRQPFDA